LKPEWKVRPLGEVCSFLNRGISPKYIEDGGICVLNQKCIRDHRVKFEPARRHNARAKKVGNERFIQPGDVLVNSTGTGTLGRVAQIREDPPEPTTVDSHVTIVRPAQGRFYQDFFGYMLIVIEDAIKEAGEGCGGQTELARSALAEKFSVRYPESLIEQQRIVGILDKAFGAIATAKANAEKNLQNARALFESHLQSALAQRDEGWLKKRLDEVCIIGDGNHSSNYPKKEELVAHGVPFIRATNLVAGRISGNEMRFLSPAKHAQLKKGHLKTGDVLFTNRGEIGKVAIVDADYDGANLNSQIAWFRCSADLENKFLFYLLNSDRMKDHFAASQNGAALQQFTIRQIKALAILLPPKKTQREIVDKLEATSQETQRLADIYEQKLASLEALKKSLLHKAFAGEL
jgi:type I restriction enzyme S subunit